MKNPTARQRSEMVSPNAQGTCSLGSMSRLHKIPRRRGVVLVAALWITIILTAVVMVMARSMRVEGIAALQARLATVD